MKKRKTYEISVIDRTYSKIISDETKFYTSDTALELVFKLKETEYTFESAEIMLLNIDDRSLVTRPVAKNLDSFAHELDDDITAHYGEWRGQLRFEQAGEIYVSSPVKFRIENDLSNERPPQLSDVQSWVSLKRYADSLTEELKQAVLSVEGIEGTFNTNELGRQTTFETNESERDETFNTNEVARQENETTRQQAEIQRVSAESGRVSAESVRAEFYDGFKSELGKKANRTQEAWQTLTLLNGTTGTIKIMKDNFGFVHLEGDVFNDVWTSGLQITTLPSGYRPETVKHFVSPANYASSVTRAFLMTPSGGVLNYGTVGQRGYINIVYKAV